ncbi:glutathione-dependent formaldehyde dehydrogenase [Micromonospora ureilytica]|uniref:zinc-dependent alcohol dehydrogenase n=1 Tax=Micromonospora ureilytica TaxID=709868 RepID=UPI002E13C59F|nr:glutathione-dependent formaldehyde dehydrogenase [Micromonospora ureilytica]
MKATAWMGTDSVKVIDVPDPKIMNARDAIVRITTTAICGSDLHLYHGYIPAMRKGDILGHEFMGEVVEVGPQVRNLKPGDRVVVPFPIACGHCSSCQRGLYSVCENSNPNAGIAEKIMGHSPAGIFGYSHLLGGYAGGQAEYARVPFADIGPVKVPDEISDDQAVMLADVFPTGYMGAEMCDIKPGQVIAIWGAGPVGLLAAASARLLGAERVIVIDRFPYRLRLAEEHTGAESINYEQADVLDTLNEMTAGRGPDACIDAVGLEGHHGNAAMYAYDRAKQVARVETERPFALRQAILACRSGGVVSVVGAYGGFVDKFPMGAFMNRSLIMRTGQCHVQRYTRPLLERIRRGEIDPSFIVSHRMPLRDAPKGYKIFQKKQDDCTKVLLKV